jgi:hypothetical protein
MKHLLSSITWPRSNAGWTGRSSPSHWLVALWRANCCWWLVPRFLSSLMRGTRLIPLKCIAEVVEGLRHLMKVEGSNPTDSFKDRPIGVAASVTLEQRTERWSHAALKEHWPSRLLDMSKRACYHHTIKACGMNL